MTAPARSRCLLLAVVAMASLAALGHSCSAALPRLERALGGDTTVDDASPQAFSFAARNLDADGRRRFEVGDSFFNRNWVIAPATTDARDGLGPTFNAAACSSCHLRDGRAQPSAHGEPGLLHRLSLPDGSVVPAYGGQLQDHAIPGVPVEGRVEIAWRERAGTLADGTSFALLVPNYRFVDMAFGPLPPGTLHSPRIAPAVIGMGLLEAIPAEDLRARADPDDRDGDGISGRQNLVPDPLGGKPVPGRFGWKAGAVSVEHQVAMAAYHDMGLTSPRHPFSNCPPAQQACYQALDGGEPELTADRLAALVFYTRTLAVPARRHAEDESARRGARRFEELGCTSCHVPEQRTGEHEVRALAHQRIFPYTDLLLHDLGPELADGRPEHDAGPSEWRTPPLWGLGLVPVVNGHRRLLHDGRARSVEEAILWHGGEAQTARDAYAALSATARAELLRFLEGL